MHGLSAFRALLTADNPCTRDFYYELPFFHSRSEIIAFLQKNVSTAVIKLGKNGAVFVDQDNIINTPALANCRVVDTTGAGDYYAAGFLFGMNCGCPPAKCAALGAICAGAIIGKTGVLLNESELQQLKYNINKEVHL
jgi:sugar/nucleoside kinase (ribokinase family)